MILSRRKIIQGIAAAPLFVPTFSAAAPHRPHKPHKPHRRPKRHKHRGVVRERVFDKRSFWYQPIPVDVGLHPQTTSLVTNLVAQATMVGRAPNCHPGSWNAPVYVVGPDEPTTAVTRVNGPPHSGLSAQWAAVPIPSYAQPSYDADGEMVIYQPSTNKMWDFWQAANVDGNWQASWGGGMSNVSTSEGTWQHPYGATATGLPLIGGQITAAELRAGQIDHVIGISLIETAHWDVVSWPASRSDGWNSGVFPGTYPAEGLRFRLDPRFNFSALDLHPVAAMIARAAQTYGFVIWDRAGSIALRPENPLSYTLVGEPDPFYELWDGTPSYQILDNFPWEHMQFMPMNYGRNSVA